MLNEPSRKAAKSRRTATGLTLLLGVTCLAVYGARHDALAGTGQLRAKSPTERDYRTLSQVLRSPIAFEPNHGQFGKQIKFATHGRGYQLAVSGTETLISLKRSGNAQDPTEKQAKASEVRMKLLGSNKQASVRGEKQLASRTNYFLGDAKDKWRRDVPNFSQVRCAGVYPGVDLVYYGNQQELEYDFVVSPGADPSDIVLGFDGASAAKVSKNGDLVLRTPGGEILHRKPVIYQEIRGQKQTVEGKYVVLSEPKAASDSLTRVAFQVSNYDHSNPLVIDPVLSWITYAGGGGNANQEDKGFGISYDPAGNIYVTGQTNGYFPVSGGYDSTFSTSNADAYGANKDLFVSKYSATGVLQWSTYLGGTADESSGGIAADASGCYVVGTSSSLSNTAANRYPLLRAYYDQTGVLGYAATLTKLNTSGNALIYSTFWGGSDWTFGYGVDVDTAGDPWIVGRTAAANMIRSTNRLQNTIHNGYSAQPTNLYDGFAVKFRNDTSIAYVSMVYSTHIGGNKNDKAIGVRTYDNGSTHYAFVTGETFSYLGFPVSTGAYQTLLNKTNPAPASGDPASDAFVVCINPSAAASSFPSSVPSRIYATYLGGVGNDFGTGIGLDDTGNAYLCGQTQSGNFPLVNAVQTTFNGPGGSTAQYDGFASKLNAAGNTLVYSTLLGGNGNDWAASIRVDANGNAYVVGFTSSSNMWIMGDYLQGAMETNGDWFILKLRPNGSGPNFSTYLGGTGYDEAQAIAVEPAGNAAVVGWTRSSATLTEIFSRLTPAYPSAQPNYGGGQADAMVARFDLNDKPVITELTPGDQALSCTNMGGEEVTFTATVSDINSDFIRVTWKINGVVVNANGQSSSPQTIDGPVFVARRAGEGGTSTPPTTSGSSSLTHTYPVGHYVVEVTVTDGLSPVTLTRTVDIVDDMPPMFVDATTGKDLNFDGDTTDPGEDGEWLPDLVLDPMMPTCDFSSEDPDAPEVEDCDALTALVATRSAGGAVTVNRTAPLTWTVTTGNFLTADNPTVITWTATDTSNPSSVAKQLVYVLDTTPPDFHIPGDKTLPATDPDGANPSATDLGILDPMGPDGKGYWATDDCSDVVTIVAFRDPSWPTGDGDDDTDDDGIPEHLDGPYPVGTTRIVWIAFDDQMNFVELYQYITVTPYNMGARTDKSAPRYVAAPKAAPSLSNELLQLAARPIRMFSGLVSWASVALVQGRIGRF